MVTEDDLGCHLRCVVARAASAAHGLGAGDGGGGGGGGAPDVAGVVGPDGGEQFRIATSEGIAMHSPYYYAHRAAAGGGAGRESVEGGVVGEEVHYDPPESDTESDTETAGDGGGAKRRDSDNLPPTPPPPLPPAALVMPGSIGERGHERTTMSGGTKAGATSVKVTDHTGVQWMSWMTPGTLVHWYTVSKLSDYTLDDSGPAYDALPSFSRYLKWRSTQLDFVQGYSGTFLPALTAI